MNKYYKDQQKIESKKLKKHVHSNHEDTERNVESALLEYKETT